MNTTSSRLQSVGLTFAPNSSVVRIDDDAAVFTPCGSRELVEEDQDETSQWDKDHLGDGNAADSNINGPWKQPYHPGANPDKGSTPTSEPE